MGIENDNLCLLTVCHSAGPFGGDGTIAFVSGKREKKGVSLKWTAAVPVLTNVTTVVFYSVKQRFFGGREEINLVSVFK